MSTPADIPPMTPLASRLLLDLSKTDKPHSQYLYYFKELAIECHLNRIPLTGTHIAVCLMEEGHSPFEMAGPHEHGMDLLETIYTMSEDG